MVNKVQIKERKFIDKGFGQKGYWAWFILLCLIGLVYKVFVLSSTLLSSHKYFSEVIIFSLFFFNLFLLVIGVVFVLQGLKTAQRMKLIEDKLDIIFYFGKHLHINIHDIQKIEKQMQNAYVRSFITPLGRGGKTYKVSVNDSFFYVNETMENALVFVKTIEGTRADGSH